MFHALPMSASAGAAGLARRAKWILWSEISGEYVCQRPAHRPSSLIAARMSHSCDPDAPRTIVAARRLQTVQRHLKSPRRIANGLRVSMSYCKQKVEIEGRR